MSALGHKQKWCHARVMSVLPSKADIRQREWRVPYVPSAEIGGLMTPGEGSPRKRAVAFVASTSLRCVAPFPFPFF